MTTQTPAQRALVQFIESMLITALIAGLFSISTYITTDGPIDWTKIVYAFGLAVAFSVAHSLAAYFKPSNVELSTLIEATAQALEKRYQTQPLQGGVQGPLVVVHPPMPTATVPIRQMPQNAPAVAVETPVASTSISTASLASKDNTTLTAGLLGLTEVPIARPPLPS